MKYQYLLTVFLIFGLLIIRPGNGFTLEKQIVITSGNQYGYAEKLFVEKDYETAMVEFKRFIYFFPDSNQKDQAQFKIGVCLFNLKKFHEAAQIFNEMILKDKDNEITKESSFYQSKAFLNLGNIGYAQIVLQNYLKLAEDRETIDRIYFNLALIHLEEVRNGNASSLGPARDYLSKISRPGAEKYHTDQYLDLIVKAETSPQKNPTLAGLFSLIPGGGFLYCERYKDALVSFLLNTGLIYAAYSAYDNDNPALAGVIGFVGAGFYAGNVYGAISSAHKYNRAQTIKFLDPQFSIRPKFDPEKNAYGLSFHYKF